MIGKKVVASGHFDQIPEQEANQCKVNGDDETKNPVH